MVIGDHAERGKGDLIEYSTCEISDALVKLGYPHGGYLPDLELMSPVGTNVKLGGPAYTVQFVYTADLEAPRLEGHFIDRIPAGTVVVVNAPPYAKNAVWGGLMTAGAKSRGALGVVIAGRCRDLAEHRAAEFTVFAKGHSTLGQSPYTRPSAIQTPITILPTGTENTATSFPGITVNPGDWILGDADGVVCVPQGLVEQVVALTRIGRQVDEQCMVDISSGAGVETTFKKWRGK